MSLETCTVNLLEKSKPAFSASLCVSAGFKHMLEFDFSPAQANGNTVINEL